MEGDGLSWNTPDEVSECAPDGIVHMVLARLNVDEISPFVQCLLDLYIVYPI